MAQDKPIKLDELAKRISAHLHRIEADSDLNRYIAHDGIERTRLFNAGAYRSGGYVKIVYRGYQAHTPVRRAEAERYLAALDAGYTGRHYDHEISKFERTQAEPA